MDSMKLADMAASKKQFRAFCQELFQAAEPGFLDGEPQTIRASTQSSCSFTKLRTARDPIL